MNRTDTIEIVGFLAATFYFKDVDEGLIRAWAIAFQNTPRLWVARHAMKWADAEKWMPKISDIRYNVSKEIGACDWQPPRHPRDEAAMWLCFIRGCGPDELTVKDLANLPPSEELEIDDIPLEYRRNAKQMPRL